MKLQGGSDKLTVGDSAADASNMMKLMANGPVNNKMAETLGSLDDLAVNAMTTDRTSP